MKLILRGLAVLTALGLALLALAAPGQAAPTGHQHRLSADQVRVLRTEIRAGTAARSTHPVAICQDNQLACQAEVLAVDGESTPATSAEPIGLGATDLESAYGLTAAPSTHDTIAILDAGAYPKAASDLAVYRAQYGLPACTKASGCFTVRNYDGGPERKPGRTKFEKFIEEEVAVETSLDLDMASAACPSCKILLVQLPPLDAIGGPHGHLRKANDHFATGVQTAKGLGATGASISYGYPSASYNTTGPTAAKMDLTGFALTASTGDSGVNSKQFSFVPWPQSLPSVIAVGGTALTQSSSGAWHEAASNIAGSGCSEGLTPPAYGQPAAISDLCDGSRASADISAVADPGTGVAVYDTYSPVFHDPLGWITVAGTSVASPLVGAMEVRAGVPADLHGPNRIYAAPDSAFNDVVTGANAPRGACTSLGFAERVCTSDDGWDGPTGRGTPRGLATFE